MTTFVEARAFLLRHRTDYDAAVNGLKSMSRRSNQIANFLRAQGLKRGDHLLLLLGNVVPLREAYVLLVGGAERSRETALSIYRHMFERLAPFKRIRKLELVPELPKTISGKIRRVQLRRLEHDNDRGDALREIEFCEEDFPELHALKSKAAET